MSQRPSGDRDPGASAALRRLLSVLRCMLGVLALTAGFDAPTQASVITFEDIKTAPLGQGGQTRITTQYAARGVVFNSVFAMDYSALPNFAHSGTQGIEQCYGIEFCTTPFEMTFSKPVASVRVWVGVSEGLRQAQTARLRVFNAAGEALAEDAVTLTASGRVPVQQSLSAQRGANDIARASVQLDAGALMNSIVLDDVEFDWQQPPQTETALPDLAIQDLQTQVEGRSARILVLVANIGTRPSPQVEIQGRSEAWASTRRQVSSLQPNEKTWITFTFAGLADGDHPFSIQIDPDGQIKERDRVNNARSGHLLIEAPSPVTPAPSPQHPPAGAPVVVPSVVGKSVAEARRELSRAHLRAGPLLHHAIGTTVDTIESQEPSAGTVVPRGTSVRLVTQSVIEVPELRGRTLDEARSALRRRMLATGAVRRHFVLGPWGAAVSSQQPQPGAVVSLNSVVDVDVDDPTPTRALVTLAGMGGVAELVRRVRGRSSGLRPRWQPGLVSFPPEVRWNPAAALPAIEISLVADRGRQTIEIRNPDTRRSSP